MKKYEVFIGSDHRGVELKTAIVRLLESDDFKMHDLGTNDAETSVDYPDIAAKVANEVSQDTENRRGILICGSGAGMCMAANRVPGILAAAAWTEDMARHIRHNDNTNVLCLAGMYQTEEQVKPIVQTWLATDFSGEKKYVRRIDKVKRLDQEQGS